MKPTPIKEILEDLTRSMGLKKRMDEERIILCWKDVVGERIGTHTKALKVRRGKLFVEVKSPVWMNELIFLKREIISKLNLRLKSKVVSDIIFVAERGRRSEVRC